MQKLFSGSKLKSKEIEIENRDTKVLKSIKDMEIALKGKVQISKSSLPKENTAIIVVDMIEGFVNEGNLKNERAEKIVGNISQWLKEFPKYKKVFVVDTHEEGSIEFEAYPRHAISGSIECEVVKELQPFLQEKETVTIVKKNSTNAFVAPDMAQFLTENNGITNFIIVGTVTDICVMQLALTLKCYLNEWNAPSRVIVPMGSVATFDGGSVHDAELSDLFALHFMKQNGIEIIDEFEIIE